MGVKKVPKEKEGEQLKIKFIELFTEELINRKMKYYKAKEEKDKVFRELEHLKTTSRLMESRIKKKLSTKPDSAYPLKLDVSLVSAQLGKNLENIVGNDHIDTVEVFYKMDNGKDVFTSDSTDNVENPSFDNIFSLTMEDSHERLYFQIYARETTTNSERLVDTFDISASIICQNLHSNGSLTDNISTSLSNHFTLCIKDKTEVNPKLTNYRSKIQKLETQLEEVEPPYKEARANFEKILNLKGVELLQEWGVCGDDIKLVKKSKTTKLPIEEDIKIEETKIHELDLDQHDRSFLNMTTVGKKKRAMTGIKSSPEKASTKHKIVKYGKTGDQFALTEVVKVELNEIMPIESAVESKPSEQRSSSTERINKTIEKRHLHKAYKTAATIPEKKEEYKTIDSDRSGELNGSPSKVTPGENAYAEMGSPLKLTAEALKTKQLGSKRMGLGSSLINFAMEDVTRVNKVKSVYNQNTKSINSIGSMMNAMSITNTLSGMLMMNNGLNTSGMAPEANDDNCSIISGGTLNTFQVIGKPYFTMTHRVNLE